MNLNKQLVEQLAKTEVQVRNEPNNRPLIKEIMKQAASDGIIPEGHHLYYRVTRFGRWLSQNAPFPDLPIIPIADFLLPDEVEWQPKNGEEVVCCFVSGDIYAEGIYCCRHPTKPRTHIVMVKKQDEEERVLEWGIVKPRPLPPITITLQEIAEWKGVSVDRIEIVEP